MEKPMGNRKKHKIIRIVLGFLCLLIVFIGAMTIYYINEVRIARKDTRALFASALKQYGTQVTLSDLSRERKKMLITIADPRFYTHHGVDLKKPGARMTTLTQSLVKFLYYPNGFHPGIAKFRQSLIAKYALNSIVSKDDQLLLFLNICYLGHENDQAVNGFANGARVYFGKEFASISDDEFLTLIAMLSGPNNFKPGSTANMEKIKSIKLTLSGKYPSTGYNDEQHRPFSQKVCMVVIKLVTDAIPD
jgi:membrane peptidoglycan carboxypeptidase